LSNARLNGANLNWADLSDANLRGADLSNARLNGANLNGADLSDANLRGSDLSNARLSRADLSGVKLSFAIPVVPGIDEAIMAEIDRGCSVDMSAWHASCGTAHCRAGWAIHLAGTSGYNLEEEVGSCAAGALIYAASRPGPVPDFYASNEEALADIRASATTKK
jgi:hypothetical protein